MKLIIVVSSYVCSDGCHENIGRRLFGTSLGLSL